MPSVDKNRKCRPKMSNILPFQRTRENRVGAAVR